MSTCWFDTFLPTSHIYSLGYLLQVFTFMSPDLSSGTVFFQLIWVTKPLKSIMKTIGILSLKKNARTQTCNILITGFFEVLYVTKFNKILCSRAVLFVKNEDTDSVGLAGVWYSAFLTSSHVSVWSGGYTLSSKVPVVLKFSLDIRIPWRHILKRLMPRQWYFKKLPPVKFGNVCSTSKAITEISRGRQRGLWEGSWHQVDVELERSSANQEGSALPMTNNFVFLRLTNSFFCSERNSNNLVPQRNFLMTCCIGILLSRAYQSGTHLLIGFKADHKLGKERRVWWKWIF